MALSFYKIFGYPTGIGALLIRKTQLLESAKLKGFFGGSVSYYNTVTEDYELKANFEDR